MVSSFFLVAPCGPGFPVFGRGVTPCLGQRTLRGVVLKMNVRPRAGARPVRGYMMDSPVKVNRRLARTTTGAIGPARNIRAPADARTRLDASASRAGPRPRPSSPGDRSASWSAWPEPRPGRRTDTDGNAQPFRRDAVIAELDEPGAALSSPSLRNLSRRPRLPASLVRISWPSSVLSYTIPFQSHATPIPGARATFSRPARPQRRAASGGTAPHSGARPR